MFKLSLIALAAATLLAPALAGAQTLQRTVSGMSATGVQWQAQSMLVGATNTQSGGPIANGGNPIFWPVYPRDSGVVHLLMDFGGPDNQFICSGTLLADRQSILTAGHCVSGGFGTATPVSTTVYFQPEAGLAAGTRIQTGGAPNGGAVTRNTTQYFVNPGYTGQVIDQNDIAVLRLDQTAPAWATGYSLYTNSDLTGRDFTVHGYGRLGDGATGANNFAARLRNGDNRYDFRLGDAVFGTGWATEFGEPFTQIEHSWLSDFDNSLPANDASCKTVNQVFGFGANPKWCDTGRGAREAGVAGGDSGGPGFIGNLVASVNSYGLTYGDVAYGDIDAALNSSFGEFSGYVPVYLHADFINAALVPEPGTYLMMALGLVGVGAVARRRRQVA